MPKQSGLCRNVTFVVFNYQVLLVDTVVPTIIINASVHNPSVAIGETKLNVTFPTAYTFIVIIESIGMPSNDAAEVWLEDPVITRSPVNVARFQLKVECTFCSDVCGTFEALTQRIQMYRDVADAKS